MPLSRFKFALTGAHGTGKTTLIKSLMERLAPTSQVIETPEAPRLITEEVGDPEFFRRGNNSFDRQCLILARQLEVEAKAADAGNQIVLCDRTIMDHWAYTRHAFPERCLTPEGKLWEAMVFRWVKTYDQIVYLTPEFAPVDDGVREADLSFQMEIDRELRRLYANAGVKHEAVTGTVVQRTDTCAILLERLSTDGIVTELPERLRG